MVVEFRRLLADLESVMTQAYVEARTRVAAVGATENFARPVQAAASHATERSVVVAAGGTHIPVLLIRG